MRCRSGGIRVRTEWGAKLIIKPLQKPPRHSPLPKSEWIVMIKQSEPKPMKCRNITHTQAHLHSVLPYPIPSHQRPHTHSQNFPNISQSMFGFLEGQT